jgi:hypothetical protein
MNLVENIAEFGYIFFWGFLFADFLLPVMI